jgi:aspartate/methionine/tyrosine aminotransferase
MTLPDRRNLQAFHPFARLNRLLEGVAPGGSGLPPALLSIGEPQNQPPAFIGEALAESADGWRRYPPPRGTEAYRMACAAWLSRRFTLPEGMIEPEHHILPVPGTREGLFFTALANVPPVSESGRQPAVLLPNPFYHVYAGAAVSAGAEPVFVPATPDNRFLPDFQALDEDILARTALCFLCSPSNPQGMAASRDYLADLIRLGRRHAFVVAFDECYGEIYNDAPPAGALEAAADLGGSLDGLLVFHSLSKRSSAAGLRCGFVVGETALIDALDAALRVGGAGVSLPILNAGARLWEDDRHVAANRQRYRDNFDIAERLIGNRHAYRRPDGGFFLWLDVGDGEAVTRALWADQGVKVLPGSYMCQATPGGPDPGKAYIRVALVHDPDDAAGALERLAEGLDEIETGSNGER